MGFAEAADLPVVLVGDVERGGVIAALVGTHALLEPAERARLKGYLINKFRGDPSLFDEAHPIIAARTGMRSYGVVPWFEQARRLPAEDVLGLEGPAPRSAAPIKIAVPRFARIANFDDLDPLGARARRAAADRASGHPAARRCRSRHPARLEGDARRPGRRYAPRAGTSTSPRTSAAAAPCSASAAASRCSAGASPIPPASRGRPRKPTASGCSISRPC